jgi:hypothetical protein
MTPSLDPSPEQPDELVARALGATAVDAELAAHRVLARIGGRSPRAVADDLTNSRLRAATAIALTALLSLWLFPGSATDPAGRSRTDLTVLAVEDPDTDPDARGTRPGDLVSELFTLTAEAPE